jgi:uncharacterized protein YndB with AHSA1/START domain
MASSTKGREIIVSKVIEAPRETVFAAFTEREHIEKWWLPKGARTDKMSVKPGGIWRYSQPGPRGLMFPYIVKFIEIDKPKRLVYDWRPDLENAPDARANVTLEDENGNTKITLHLVFATAAEYKNAMKYGAIVGAMQALEALNDHVMKS